MSAITISLVGNPNCGKSTLFNELTGSNQKVGNWPGVTVERKIGQYHFERQDCLVVDLPGIYQLVYTEDDQAIDERIACEYVLKQNVDIIINIIDAVHLERHLFLTLQLLSLNIPMIIAVNMMDVAKKRHIKIDLDKLQRALGCPIIGLVANKGFGIETLKKQIANHHRVSTKQPLHYPAPIRDSVTKLQNIINDCHPQYTFCSEWLAQQLLQDNDSPIKVATAVSRLAAEQRALIASQLNEDLDIIFADVIYTMAHQIATQAIEQTPGQRSATDRIDKIVLNRFLGIPIFLAIMYCMFLFAINLGGAFQDLFDIGSNALFVQGIGSLLNQWHAPSWLVALLAAGFGRGVNTTLSFIPVIGAMFFFLAFLESSGYMARASFVVDRLMRAIGLPGKSFVPMIVGFGCNVPAILAARTLESERDRKLTILMSPFMSCGARLAIFAVFTAAFFPSGGQNIVFLLYLIGIVAAVLTGFILRKTLLKGELTPLILELPAYHLPSFKALLKSAWQRLNSFIFRAGKLIVPICMIIGVLNAINVDGTLNRQDSSATSLLSSVGRLATPALAPIGISEQNWPATVGLVTGVLAKEVVVATLNTLYSQDGHLTNNPQQNSSLIAQLKEAVFSVPTNLAALSHSLINPILASAPENSVNHGVYGVMYERFNGQVGAFAYLLFVLLYFPCISATAVMAKELNKKWTLFSVIWSTAVAYSVSSCFYQLATFSAHPKTSFIWVGAIGITFCLIFTIMKRYGSQQDQTRAKICC